MAAYSEVEICNLALNEVGRGGQITSLDEQSTSARACKQRYPYSRDAVLRSYDWNFAAKRALCAVVPTSKPPFEYENAYQLPNDCLLVRSIYCGEDQKYKIEGKLIVANWGEEPVPIIYTALIDDPTQFDPLFVSALAARIASDICATITESSARSQALWSVYQAKLQEARKRDAQEGQADVLPIGSWITSRF
jgi:ABC-type amino acid transport substrate-binding protein